VKTVEQIREEIAKVLYELPKHRTHNFAYLKEFISEKILAIEVGGDVVEECDICLGDKEWYSTGDNIWVDCKTCHGTGKLTRPRLLKDLLEAK
jgi:hypothetical protein